MTNLTDAVIFLSLAFGVLLVWWLVRKAIRFALGPPPDPFDVGEVERPFPGPVIESVAVEDRLQGRARFGEYECATNYNAEFTMNPETLADRSKKAWLN